MAKNKLTRFAELGTYSHVIQPALSEVFNKKHPLYGKWNEEFYFNENPIVLELGCGKGEYTVGLAEKYPDVNFLGIDIKGARMWKGASYVNQRSLKNVGFLRTRIEFITSFFAPGEVSEIWLPFPDPQLKKPKKRLTSPRFLNMYTSFLKTGGYIHLKTDSFEMYHYTLEVINYNGLPLLASTGDLYNSDLDEEALFIKTFYENMHLSEGKKIHYIKFAMPRQGEIVNIESDGK